MKLAIFVCVALLAVLLQAEDGMSPTTLPGGTRVINGTPAQPGQLPFMAYVKSEDGPGTRHCGGSLITRRAVLTSSWCVREHNKYTIRLGSIYRTTEDGKAWTAVSTWAVWHPDFNSTTKILNVGIIYLPRKAPINDYIQLVDLPSSPDVGSFVGCEGIVSGWGGATVGSGVSEVLQWTEVLVVPNEICGRFLSKKYVSDRSLCAGGFTSAVYNGDDGGALVLRNFGGSFLQIGIHHARDHYSDNVPKPAVYTRLSSSLEWIRMKTMHN